jgi:hypothetical protein
MSDYIKFKLIKLAILGIGAVIYGFISARRKRLNSRRRPGSGG